MIVFPARQNFQLNQILYCFNQDFNDQFVDRSMTEEWVN